MSIELDGSPSLTDVVSGIVTDFQKLVAQQLALLRAEVKSDWDKSKRALLPMLVGSAFVAVGILLFGFAAVYGLHSAFSPIAADMGRFPLWACFAITAAAFIVVGAALIVTGVKLFQSFNPLPNESAEALEKNLKALVESRTVAPHV